MPLFFFHLYFWWVWEQSGISSVSIWAGIILYAGPISALVALILSAWPPLQRNLCYLDSAMVVVYLMVWFRLLQSLF